MANAMSPNPLMSPKPMTSFPVGILLSVLWRIAKKVEIAMARIIKSLALLILLFSM